jgi:hypothetical protein
LLASSPAPTQPHSPIALQLATRPRSRKRARHIDWGQEAPLDPSLGKDHSPSSLRLLTAAPRPATCPTQLHHPSRPPPRHLPPSPSVVFLSRPIATYTTPPPTYPTTKLPPLWRVSIMPLLPFALRLVRCCRPSPPSSIRVFICLEPIANMCLLHRGGRRSRH